MISGDKTAHSISTEDIGWILKWKVRRSPVCFTDESALIALVSQSGMLSVSRRFCG